MARRRLQAAESVKAGQGRRTRDDTNSFDGFAKPLAEAAASRVNLDGVLGRNYNLH